MLLVKLKNLLTSACLNLNYGAVKQKQKYKGCKDTIIYQILAFTNVLASLILGHFCSSIILLPPFYWRKTRFSERVISFCLRESVAWGHGQK